MQKNPVLVRNMKAAIDAGKAIHFMGLMGTGGVHSHEEHLFGLLDMAKALGAKDVYVHAIMDGRDTRPPRRRALPAERPGQAGRHRHRQDRHRHRPLLRHGPRQELGPRGESLRRLCLRRGREGRQLERVHRAQLCQRRHRRVRGALRHLRGRPRGRRGHGGVHQLPAGPRPPDDPHLRGRRVQRLRAAVWPLPRPLRLHDRVRRHHAQLRGGLSPGGPDQRHGRVYLQPGHDPAAHRRDREVCPRHLLLQRRPGRALRRRGPLRHPQPQGGHLRPEARDERPRSGRGVRQADRERQVRRHHPELCQLRHGGATPACLTLPSRPWRPWTSAPAR